MLLKHVTALFVIQYVLMGSFSYSQEIENIDALVKKLGDKNYKTRSEARSKLWLLGEGKLEEIDKYKDIKDPQIRYNINLLSKYLYFGVSVGTTKEKLELIDRLISSNSSENIKTDVKSLIDDKEFEILVKMHLLHESESVRVYLKPIVNKIIITYLRGLYDEGNFTKAEAILKALEKSDIVAQGYAALLIYKKRSEVFIEEMDFNDKEAVVVALYIHLAKKRWGEALKLAEKLDKKALICKLNLYKGNVDKLLDYTQPFKSSTIQKQALSAAKAINNNDFSAAGKSLELIEKTFNKNTTVGRTILLRTEMLMVNGVNDHLDTQLEKFYLGADDASFSLNIVDYCVSSGRMDAFYKVINCPADRNGQLKWAKKIIKNIQQNKELALNLSARSEISNLMHYVYYMALNNETELISDLLDPLMEVAIFRLANKELTGNKELFNNLISHALSHGYEWYLVDVMHSFNPEAFTVFSKTIEDIILDQIGAVNLNLLKLNLKQVSEEKGLKHTESELLEKVLLLQGLSKKSSKFNVSEIQKNIIELPQKENQEIEVLTMLCSAAAKRGDISSIKMLADKIQKILRNEYQYFIYTQEILMAESKWQEAYTYTNAYYKDLQEKRELKNTTAEGEIKNLPLNQNYISHMVKDLIMLVKLSKHAEAQIIREKLKLYLAGDKKNTFISMLELSSHQLNEDYMDYFESILFNEQLYNNEITQAVAGMNLVNNVYIKQGKYKEAYSVAIFHKYLTINRVVNSSPLQALRISNQADLTKGLSLFKSDPKLAETYLRRCVETSINGGILADFYFPAVSKIGLKKLHKESFEIVQKEMLDVVKKYPNNSNALNGYAWTAAKTGYDLNNAKMYSKRSLELSPFSSAYLDTLAEIHFALKDRENAIKYSVQALDATFSGKERQNYFVYNIGSYGNFMSVMRNRKLLNEQFEHFKNDSLSK